MPSKAEVIVLIGPMGVGKTTVGKKLAKALKVSFTDTDAVIASQHGPIAELFKNHGEEHFRALEQDVVAAALSVGGVIATGGGAILSKKTRDALASSATVFYLATDGKHIASRLLGSKRPLLNKGTADWQRIYDERKPVYEASADFTIDTSGQPLKTTVNAIIDRLEVK